MIQIHSMIWTSTKSFCENDSIAYCGEIYVSIFRFNGIKSLVFYKL